MIVVHCFKDKKVALFGLGGSGLATAKALKAGGAEVVAWDDKAQSVKIAKSQGIPTGNLKDIVWSGFSALILAPGVPLTHPKPHWTVEKAKAAGIEIIGDIELFIRERDAFLKREKLASNDVPFIAITGTNGKSTTTALINHLVEKAGRDAQMGGNIGTAILSLDALQLGRVYIIECSSFQIDLTPSINPTVGILLNITPDHIDRHGSFEHYASIKESLIDGSDIALVGVDDEASKVIFDRCVQKGKKAFAVAKDHSLDDGYYAQGTELYFAQNAKVETLVNLTGIASLRGSHNAQNALMAIGASRAIGLDQAGLQKALQNFGGLPHRMQQVRKIGHTLFINDSKATNAEASAPALASFGHIYWIIGGLAKEGGIHALTPFFPKIRKAYLIGEAAEDFAKTIDGAFPVSMSGTLEKAVNEAAKDAALDQNAEVAVLLSPACASYDQFANYGARGDAFVSFVQKL